MTKWIIGVVAVALVAGGAWWFFSNGQAGTQGAAVQTATSTSTSPDTSDQALMQDSASIDSQLQVLDSQQ